MSDNNLESLSALMDGEADEMTVHRTLKDIEANPELKEAWSRFHMGSDAIKGTLTDFRHLDISAAVNASIKEESFEGGESGNRRGWLKAVGGLSIAASVTFAVVLGARFNPLLDSNVDQTLVSNQSGVQISSPNSGTLMIAKGDNPIVTPELNEAQLQQAQERLNIYLKQHAKDSALGQGRTAMPFARVVNFETSSKTKGNE